MKENKLVNLSIEFAVEVVRLCEQMKRHPALISQIERSATSIGANIHEANYAHSKIDFIAKLQIALKECYETEYWLEILSRANLIDLEKGRVLYRKCGTIRKVLISSVNTTRKGIKKC